MPVKLNRDQRERFLNGRHIAVLITIDPDGTPIPSPIWYLFRNGVFYFNTADNAIKTMNVRHDPRVSICVQDERPPYKAVVAYGKAEIGVADEALGREMARHYLGAIGGRGYEAAAREQIEQSPAITLIVRPDRYTSFDFTPETPIYGRAWLMLKRVLPPWL